MKRKLKLNEWQLKPENVKTEKVQYWTSAGTMLTAQMLLKTARQMVAEGRAYVITEQAIGEL
mgnify:CR=1 FL=1